ncbi:hypothetical protein [Pigmentiphaga sp.]|uniref:hypothetical protein n=1 Tax=Pigmentiphaga sp. TaxID=1977564 RepID=UPI00128D3B0E|nr:hypothetical protein [Pigmentiphaga sp.]MPS28429.1 hypothetical protein [Alcaligenaceae bacterium SAGV5]MPS52094.1 hypothetical protein [Alcaligenaceae bacterium SAGV3]MPT56250.1 hypothetical protein [Alcaligenaceae bacterium]
MRLSDDIRQFILGDVMIIIGTRDATNRASIARGVGVRASGGDTVEVLVSGWQWAETIANIQASPCAAITFSRPRDYVSYQLKGSARSRTADQADAGLARSYTDRMIAMFAALGVPENLVRPWCCEEDLHVVRLRVQERYIQTPGPKAGTAL